MNKVIENAVKYEILVNYLKDSIEKDDYISTKEITKLLKSMEGEKEDE